MTDLLDIAEIYDEIEKDKQKKRKVLGALLEEQLTDKNQVLVTRAQMAAKDSFLGTANLRWIRDHVQLATEMPFLKFKRDEKTKKLVINEESISEMRQREPDHTRQAPLVRYMVGNSDRKFPPLTVVVAEDWIGDSKSEYWGNDGRANQTSWTVMSLSKDGQIGLLQLGSKTLMYAADGQHRVIGIQGIFELIKLRKLTLKSKEGAERKGGEILLDDLLTEFGIDESQVDAIEKETLGIEFIPAVIQGETAEEARERVVNVFVNVNKSAVATNASQEAILANDGFSKVARKLALSHKAFEKDRAGDRVNMKSSAIPVGSKWTTALVTLVDMTRNYLGGDSRFSHWSPKIDAEVAHNPPAPEVTAAVQELAQLWDQILTLPTFSRIGQGHSLDELREFPSSKYPKGEGQLLLRPIGQLVLADAVKQLHLDDHGPKLSLDPIFKKLRRFDREGGFKASEKDSVFYGITYEPSRQRMIMGKTQRQLAADLLIYLINGPINGTVDELRDRFRKARTFKAADGTVTYINHDGKTVKFVDDIDLPLMI